MNVEILIERYPRLFHLSEPGNWSSIEKFGLLSTSALLNLFQINPDLRYKIESSIRSDFFPISHDNYGEILIRDNKPMIEKHLVMIHHKLQIPILGDGLTPAEWCQILNSRVFFWLTKKKLETMFGAYKHRDNLVLVVDTKSLVTDYLGQIDLSPINSGNTKPYPQPRGLNTFLPVSQYPYEDWLMKRGNSGDPIVELTVRHGIPNITKYIIKTKLIPKGQALIIDG